MRQVWITLGVVGIIVALGFGWFVSTGNGLVTKDEAVRSGWSQVENVYQRRLDLIPNLVNTVKGYAAHEKSTLEGVIQARASATQIDAKSLLSQPDGIKKFQAAQDHLSGALSRLMVVVEKYPDLKANENFKTLMSQIEGTENRISVERKRFNELVQDFNTSIKMFPASFVATSRGLAAKAYFESSKEAAKAPEVKF